MSRKGTADEDYHFDRSINLPSWSAPTSMINTFECLADSLERRPSNCIQEAIDDFLNKYHFSDPMSSTVLNPIGKSEKR